MNLDCVNEKHDMYQFREATENDFEAICKLVPNKEELFLMHPNGQYPFTVAQIQELSRVRKELTVAVFEDRIIGFTDFYDFNVDRFAFIGNVIIYRDYRGRGIGRKMISHMVKIAYEKYKLPEIRISAFNQNAPALLLYSSLGFTPYEIEEKQDWDGNRIAIINLKKKCD